MSPYDPFLSAGAERRQRRRRGFFLLLTSLGLLTLGAGSGSLALFTDDAAAAATFSTGTIDLTASPSTVFTASAIMPGASGSQTVAVSNTGSGALRYALTSAATDLDGLGLRNQLGLTVTAGACPGAGPAVYGPGAMGSAAFGSPAQGADPGDRTLAAGASEDLCFAWSLPLSTGNAFQGAATSVTFTFSAEQTANNP